MSTVLVCDDEDVLRALIRATLGTRWELIEARDGEEALELARSERPDLVILDVMMPGRTGLQVLADIRADPSLADTQVIMLTARTQAEDIAAVEAADAYLPKPFSPAALAELADRMLQHAA